MTISKLIPGEVHMLLKNAITIFANMLSTLVLIRCILSWIPMRRTGMLVQLLYALTDPIILPIRAMIDKSPLGGGVGKSGVMLDFSPIIAMLLIGGVHRLLMQIL